MGLLRLLLALCVVAAHSSSGLGQILPGGSAAVQAFFVVSGFYMALVLNEKYTFRGSVAVFYQQRYLRLAPMYWVTLGLTILAAVTHTKLTGYPSGPIKHYLESWTGLSTGAKMGLILTQSSMFGMDALTFFHLNGKLLSFVYSTSLTDQMNGTAFTVVTQSWSLSLELLFYLIAPFVVRRSAIVLGLLVAVTWIIRMYCKLRFGLNGAWDDHFFPFELGLFSAGALAYKSYAFVESSIKSGRITPYASYAGLFVFFGLFLLYGKIPIVEEVKRWIFLLSVACAIPVLFSMTRRSEIDRWIGELSYPLYLLHSLCIGIIYPLMVKSSGITREAVIYCPAIAVAIVAQIALEARFDRFRHGLLRSREPSH